MKEYIEHALRPWQELGVIELSVIATTSFSAINWLINIFIPEWIGLSVALFFLYLGMTLLDTCLGIVNSVFRKKEEFDKDIFFKKIFMVALALIALGMTSHLESYTKLEYVKPLFEACRLFFYVSFLIYEFTGIRDKCIALEMTSIVSLIDIILLPLNLIKDGLKKKFDSDKYNPEEKNEEN